MMPTETTYTSLRQNLASVLDRVVDQQETVIVRRKGSRDVALIPAGELAERDGVPNLPTTTERRDYTIVVTA